MPLQSRGSVSNPE